MTKNDYLEVQRDFLDEAEYFLNNEFYKHPYGYGAIKFFTFDGCEYRVNGELLEEAIQAVKKWFEDPKEALEILQEVYCV